MKHPFSLQSIICICLPGLILSCSKRGDLEVPCRIIHVEKTNASTPTDVVYDGYFEYTSWGDPSKIIWSETATGRPNYFFKYDNKRRLTQSGGRYAGTVFDHVTNYIYDASNKIVADSFWYFGSDINNYRATAYGWNYDQYTYDNKGRIIKIDVTTSFGVNYTQNYTYDANGNLAIPGAVYDNKKNYLRTSLVLMFICRNFSVNNYKAADTYNNKGLPTSFSGESISLITGMNSLIDKIDYDCGHFH
jgi:hypothetical protein